MNNLNFAVDAMTRSFQTGVDPEDINSISGVSNCPGFSTQEVDYEALAGGTAAAGGESKRKVSYCLNGSKLIKYIDGGDRFDLTSKDVNIQEATFKCY